MNSESKEHLSSLMDGEVTRESGRFLIRRLAGDESMRATWASYHVIRDCLRNQQGEFGKLDLSERVSKALADEPAPASSGFRSAWLKPVAGLTVAASVALFAVMTVSTGPGSEAPSDPVMAQAAAPAPFTSPNIGSLIPKSQPVNLNGEIRPDNRKMNAYLLRHYQAAGETGKGFVSFVPIVVTRASDSPVTVTVEEPDVDDTP